VQDTNAVQVDEAVQRLRCRVAEAALVECLSQACHGVLEGAQLTELEHDPELLAKVVHFHEAGDVGVLVLAAEDLQLVFEVGQLVLEEEEGKPRAIVCKLRQAPWPTRLRGQIPPAPVPRSARP
jgi:hypothetical protein